MPRLDDVQVCNCMWQRVLCCSEGPGSGRSLNVGVMSSLNCTIELVFLFSIFAFTQVSGLMCFLKQFLD